MYASQTDLEKRINPDILIDLTDDGDTGSVDADILAAALADADATIDARLAERYSLPLAESHAILTTIAVDLAVCNLYDRREGPPDHWFKRRENSLELVERIVRGEISLGASDPLANSDAGAISATEPVFTSETLKNF